MVTIELPETDVRLIADRLGELARAGAYDSDDLSEPLRWLSQAIASGLAEVDLPGRGRRASAS